jgi:hypothetical protein
MPSPQTSQITLPVSYSPLGIFEESAWEPDALSFSFRSLRFCEILRRACQNCLMHLSTMRTNLRRSFINRVLRLCTFISGQYNIKYGVVPTMLILTGSAYQCSLVTSELIMVVGTFKLWNRSCKKQKDGGQRKGGAGQGRSIKALWIRATSPHVCFGLEPFGMKLSK